MFFYYYFKSEKLSTDCLDRNKKTHKLNYEPYKRNTFDLKLYEINRDFELELFKLIIIKIICAFFCVTNHSVVSACVVDILTYLQ